MEKWYVSMFADPWMFFFRQLLGKYTICGSHEILLMEEILHQSVGSWNPIIYKVYTFRVVQDFFHQQFLSILKRFLNSR